MRYLLKKEWGTAVKNGVFWAALAAILSYINGPILYWFFWQGVEMPIPERALGSPLEMMRRTQTVAQVVFIILVILSVSVFWRMKKSDIFQISAGRFSYTVRLAASGASVVMACGAVALINIIAYDMLWLMLGGSIYPPLIFNLIKCWVLNIVLPSAIATLLGLYIALVCKKLAQAFVAVMLCIFTFGGLIGIVLEGYSVQAAAMYKIVDLFAIYPTGLVWLADSNYGFPAEGYRLAILLFWLAALPLLIYIRLKPGINVKDGIKKGALAVISLMLAVYIALPNGAVRKSDDLYGGLETYPAKDQLMLYWGKTNVLKERQADFTVTAYALNIRITNMLNATATIDVQNTNDTLYFTLYYGYKVQKVQDGSGNSLKFAQSGDAVVIYATKGINRVVITYRGYGHYYYSNDQAMYLSGQFAYYPIPGVQGSMHIDAESLYKDVYLPQPVPFTITADAPYKVYSSLPQKADGTFYGITDRPTLIGGLSSVQQHGNITQIGNPVTSKSHYAAPQDISRVLDQLCSMYGVRLPEDFAYTCIQAPELMYFEAGYFKDYCLLGYWTEPLQWGHGILAAVLGDPQDPATRLLDEYARLYEYFATKYMSIGRPETEYEALCCEWCAFAQEYGQDTALYHTAKYVVQQLDGGLMEYLNTMVQKAEVQTDGQN